MRNSLQTYQSLTKAGIPSEEARASILREGALGETDSLQVGSSLLPTSALPKLGTSLKIARKKQLFSLLKASTSQLSANESAQIVKDVEMVRGEGSQVLAASRSTFRGPSGLMTKQEVAQLIAQLQIHVEAQEKVVSDLMATNLKMSQRQNLHLHYQALLKQKESELVKKDVEHYKEKQELEKAKQMVEDKVEGMVRHVMNNKLSLQLFYEWTKNMEEKMVVELEILCANNVNLQVDNQVMLHRMGPLVAIEKQVLAQEDVGIQGVLVFEADLGVMREAMTQVGNDVWKEIRSRLEGCIQKPFNTLKVAFISEHEVDLLKKVEFLEGQFSIVQEENAEFRKQLFESESSGGKQFDALALTCAEANKEVIDPSKLKLLGSNEDELEIEDLDAYRMVKCSKGDVVPDSDQGMQLVALIGLGTNQLEKEQHREQVMLGLDNAQKVDQANFEDQAELNLVTPVPSPKPAEN